MVDTKSGTTNTDASQLTVNHKRSLAVRVWIGITTVVLGLLWLQMRNNRAANYNLFLSGDSTSAGAQVVIDGHEVGHMSGSEKGGLGGAGFYGHLGNGQHSLQVNKPGFEPFKQDIIMHSEHYANVELKPDSADDGQP